MDWILILVIPGFMSVADVKFVPMTERQCRATLTRFAPAAQIKPPQIGLTCVGPNGDVVTIEDAKK